MTRRCSREAFISGSPETQPGWRRWEWCRHERWPGGVARCPRLPVLRSEASPHAPGRSREAKHDQTRTPPRQVREGVPKSLEHETGFEPATSTLATFAKTPKSLRIPTRKPQGAAPSRSSMPVWARSGHSARAVDLAPRAVRRRGSNRGTSSPGPLDRGDPWRGRRDRGALEGVPFLITRSQNVTSSNQLPGFSQRRP
jgi:hypothetical protein